jgi:hypothetical protein
VLSRQDRTLIVQLPAGITGKTARVRVGKARSNSVKVYGLQHLKPGGKAKGEQGGAGINQALGQDD